MKIVLIFLCLAALFETASSVVWRDCGSSSEVLYVTVPRCVPYRRCPLKRGRSHIFEITFAPSEKNILKP